MDIDENKEIDTTTPTPETEEDLSAVDTLEEDTVVEEFVFDEDGEANMALTLKKLRKDLKQAQKEKQEYLTSWQRERADFMNYKKDEATKMSRMNALSRERFAEELLPVLDSYDMAFQNKEAWEKVDKNWRMGVEYIHQQLLKVLSENGVEEIRMEEGDQFDPNLHESVETVATDDKRKEHTVAKILQKGYKTSAGVLRPGRVNVFEYKQ
jgi:molecular chaperone GrpE